MEQPTRVVTLIALIRRTGQLMADEITYRLDEAGYVSMPPPYHTVFENLDPGGTRLTVLAKRAGLTHQSMGELVAEIERRGYVERVPDPADGRARLIRLTDEGREVVRTALTVIADIEQRWTARWRKAGLRGDLRAAFEAGLREEGWE
jgi:DNA-binding MarR family transcriptional regulator